MSAAELSITEELTLLQKENNAKSFWQRLIEILNEYYWVNEVNKCIDIPAPSVEPISHAEAWKDWIAWRNSHAK